MSRLGDFELHPQLVQEADEDAQIELFVATARPQNDSFDGAVEVDGAERVILGAVLLEEQIVDLLRNPELLAQIQNQLFRTHHVRVVF